MSRNTRRSLSLPARMAAAGVDRVFVAEATTLALGYGSQRLTNSRLWSDNMVLRTRADLSDALLREAMGALENAMGHMDTPISRRKIGIDPNAEWLLDARATLANLRTHLKGDGKEVMPNDEDNSHERPAVSPRLTAGAQAIRDKALDEAAQAASNRAAYWWDASTAADDTGRKKLSLIFESKALACTENAAAIRAMKGKPE